MLKSIRNHIATFQIALLFVTLTCPLRLRVSAGTPSENGIGELQSLVARSSGKPSASDLTAIESRYPNTRAAGLARFLLGYLYYSSQNYQAAVEALVPNQSAQIRRSEITPIFTAPKVMRSLIPKVRRGVITKAFMKSIRTR